LFIVLLSPLFSFLQSGVVLASAESTIPKPSVPDFTVALVDASYDVPTTYSTDPYTGKTITHGGYHVERRTIEIRIKNQPFNEINDWGAKFYYSVRYKGHFTEEWFDVYQPYEMPTQSNSDYTVISYNSENRDPYSFYLAPAPRSLVVSPNGQVDFQVKALVGSACEGSPFVGIPSLFSGEESDWSATQTITIPPVGSSSSSTSTPDQTAEPTPKETQQTLRLEATMEFFPPVPVEVAAIATVIVVVVVCAGLLVYFKKCKHEA